MWAAPVHAMEELNCADFGTRERAQREFVKVPTDVHDLDRDGDGKACEANPSTGWWPWMVASAGLVAGRAMARRRTGDHRMLPGWEGFVFNYEFSPEGDADKVMDKMLPALAVMGVVALPVVGVLRDHVFPRSAAPLAFHVATGVMSMMVAYAAVSWRTSVTVDGT